MDIFGKNWENYVYKLEKNWNKLIDRDDWVIMPGDFSWATYLEEAKADFEFLNKLPGKKILLKGNHDYWWTSHKKLDEFAKKNGFENILFLHNNAFMCDNTAICGNRGWVYAEEDSDEDYKIYSRELIRLELSLKEAERFGAEETIAFTHYPPLFPNKIRTPVTEILKGYGIKRCYYGHLHAASHKNAVTGEVDGIDYHLISCDFLEFTPKFII